MSHDISDSVIYLKCSTILRSINTFRIQNGLKQLKQTDIHTVFFQVLYEPFLIVRIMSTFSMFLLYLLEQKNAIKRFLAI